MRVDVNIVLPNDVNCLYEFVKHSRELLTRHPVLKEFEWSIEYLEDQLDFGNTKVLNLIDFNDLVLEINEVYRNYNDKLSNNELIRFNVIYNEIHNLLSNLSDIEEAAFDLLRLKKNINFYYSN